MLSKFSKVLIVSLGLSASSAAIACTSINIQATDHTIISGRTLEWGDALIDSHFTYIPKDTAYQLTAPESSSLPTINLKSKYAIFGITSKTEQNLFLDGQNSAGLTISILFFPGYTQFQTVTKKDQNYFKVTQFPVWVLANFKTAQDVVNELPKYKLWSPDKIGPIPPSVHFVITDKTGNSFVLEYTKNGLEIFKNIARTLTNAPGYDWHLTNTANYVNLSTQAPKPIGVFNSQKSISQLGQGGGTTGLPGGYLPADRFIRVAFLNNFATPAKNANKAIELAAHILNTVDIPKGIVKADKPGLSDYTQWIEIKDLTNNQFYFADYEHRTNYIHLDLNAIFKLKTGFNLDINKIKYPDNNLTNNFISLVK